MNQTKEGMATAAKDRAQTRIAIIDSAEQLWGAHGIEGVSLKQITMHAGCANSSAIQYHFGDRQGLIEALYRTRIDQLEVARARLLADYTNRDGPLPLATLLYCIYQPFADQRDRNGRRSYAAFLLNLAINAQDNLRSEFDIESPVTDSLSKAVYKKLYPLSNEEIDTRMSLSSGLYWHGLILDDYRGINRSACENKMFIDQLISMMESVLTK